MYLFTSQPECSFQQMVCLLCERPVACMYKIFSIYRIYDIGGLWVNEVHLLVCLSMICIWDLHLSDFLKRSKDNFKTYDDIIFIYLYNFIHIQYSGLICIFLGIHTFRWLQLSPPCDLDLNPVTLRHRMMMFHKHLVCSLFPVYHMKETGWEFISRTDTAELHYKFQEEKKKW